MEKPKRINLRGSLTKAPSSEKSSHWRPTITHREHVPVTSKEGLNPAESLDSNTLDTPETPVSNEVAESPEKKALRELIEKFGYEDTGAWQGVDSGESADVLPVPPAPPAPPETPSPAEPPATGSETAPKKLGTPILIGGRNPVKVYVTKQEGTPEWRKLGKDDDRLNESKAEKEKAEIGMGTNPILERQSSGGPSNKASFAEYIKKQKEQDSLVAERREARSEKFAEKFGLTELRNAKISAEKAAYQQDLKHHKNPLRRVNIWHREHRDEVRRKADEATLAWNKALANLPEGATARERLEALIIRKRDTIITPNALRTQARTEALNERSKTLLGKVLNAPGWTAKKALQGMGAVSGGIGKGLFSLFGKKHLSGAALEREQAIYRRAGQIITGATIGSVMGIVAGPGGLAAAAGIIGFSTFRTTLGTAVGTGAGYAAGLVNKHTFDKSTKKDYRDQVRNTDVNYITELKAQQRAEKHGSRENRQKRAQVIKVGAAVLAGGATSLELGHFAHLPSVQHALHQHPPLTPEHPKVPTEKLQMEIGGKNAEGVVMNNSDRLFGHFGLMLQRDFAHVAHPHTPAIDTYLKLLQGPDGHGVSLHHGEDHIARAFGFETNGAHGGHPLSEIMHNGDKIELNKAGQMEIVWADHARPPHILINTDGSINHNIDDITKHLSHPHVAAEHAVTASDTSSTEAASASGTPTLHPENLGAAPEPAYSLSDSVARARESAALTSLNAEHANIVAERNNLLNSTTDPNYRHLLDQYNRDAAIYKSHLDAYQAAHPAAAPDATPSAPERVAHAPASPEVATHAAAESPSSPSVRVDIPSVDSLRPSINSFGTHIDPTAPHRYLDQGHVVVWGGKDLTTNDLQTKLDVVSNHLNTQQDPSAVAYTEHSRMNPDTGVSEKFMYEVHSNGEMRMYGPGEYPFSIDPKDFKPIN